MLDGVSARYPPPLHIPLLIAGMFVPARVPGYAGEKRLVGNAGDLPIVRRPMARQIAEAIPAGATVVRFDIGASPSGGARA